MAKLKVLFLYDFPLWGSGSASFIRNLSRHLLKDHQVGIVCPENRKFHKDIKQYPVKLSQIQIPVFVGHPELGKAKKYCELTTQEITELYKNYLDAVLKAMEEFNPDIIHVHHVSLITWAARYFRSLAGIKYIVTTHGSCLHNISLDRRYYSLTIDALRKAAMITAVSGDTKAWFLKMFGQEFSEKLRTIPGGIDIKRYPCKKETKKTDEKYDLKDKKIVLFTGRLISHKGVKYLVKAAKKIKGDVFIIGDGPEKKYLLKLVKELKLKNVHLLGYMGEQESEELKDFYYRADVFVAPSVWEEPLGLTILEAMASKTPVVVTRKGGIPLAVKDGVNGIFVRPHNSNQIAEAVNKLLENEKLRKKMGENARKIVEQKFTWDKITQKFKHVYQKCANNSNNSK